MRLTDTNGDASMLTGNVFLAVTTCSARVNADHGKLRLTVVAAAVDY